MHSRIQAKRPIISVTLTHDVVESLCSFLKMRAITREYDMDVLRKTLSLHYLINVHFHETFFTILSHVIIIRKLTARIDQSQVCNYANLLNRWKLSL